MKQKIKQTRSNIWNMSSVNTEFIRWKLMGFLGLCLSFYSCTDFVEVDPPKNNLSTKTVFDDAATVKSALANIYLKMRDESLVSGNNGLSTLMGIYTDELDYYLFDTANNQLYQHNVLASNSTTNSWWTNAYSILYAANDIITEVENSKLLSADEKAEFNGQALFVRAYIHSLLASLYGDVPYITTTNYLENNTVSRTPIGLVYENIINDLKAAVNLLKNEDVTGEKVIPNKAVANALLARMYLYTENWEMAESTASILINTFSLEPDVTKVFLKSAASTLWQFKPNGISILNTYEANQFVIRFIPGQAFALHEELLGSFEPGDLRRLNWVGSTTSADGLTTLHYANKYKSIFNATVSLEYSILFRLEEQYLIRAEAQAQLNNLLGSQTDLNTIRNRAGLDDTVAATKEELISAILQERFLEFFTEQGHRWFDLKRTGEAENTLSTIKSNWKNTDILLPIPDAEIAVNPNLKPQNVGY
ncbi:RagB/SusD family nutrient uptake outer membrane protein [Cellulophaga baltica]|uniref:RagB/SusD domain-containing protein n=1 Tax=Cellulophaga baltica TaxID=76594 RepID=A0A1G7ECD8_9FLAO|nr:RagB/SusD family nutrient uptake outer membrane protein [Cellulophaga baltica]SDE61329.1 RagB/SusD domain-containing protein [Cellulophaga baltica]